MNLNVVVSDFILIKACLLACFIDVKNCNKIRSLKTWETRYISVLPIIVLVYELRLHIINDLYYISQSKVSKRVKKIQG